jgi:predicted nuclease with TOPRIM domain
MDVQLEQKTAECTHLHEKVNQYQASLTRARQTQDDLEAHVSRLNAQERSLLNTIFDEQTKVAEFENRYANLYSVNETLLRLLSDDQFESGGPPFDAQGLLLANQEQQREIEELRSKVVSQSRIMKEVSLILQQITNPVVQDETMVDSRTPIDDDECSCWSC